MLLQRLRKSEPSLEAAIAYNLVDLAIPASAEVVLDIAKSYSYLSMSVMTTDPSSDRQNSVSTSQARRCYSSECYHSQILAAQTRLAHELEDRPDQLRAYLRVLLSLFNDLGTAIQVNASTHNHLPVCVYCRIRRIDTYRMLILSLYQNPDHLRHLSGLILPIESLLSHSQLSPHIQPNPETANLFQDFWLIVALFRLCDSEVSYMNEWKSAGLVRIAAKTPVFVTEEAQDYISSNLEYNRVLRKDYVEHVRSSLIFDHNTLTYPQTSQTLQGHRSALTKCLGGRSGDVRHLTGAQCIFVLALHDIENLRAGLCLPSALPSYFVNGSINENAHLLSCMEIVADVVSVL